VLLAEKTNGRVLGRRSGAHQRTSSSENKPIWENRLWQQGGRALIPVTGELPRARRLLRKKKGSGIQCENELFMS